MLFLSLRVVLITKQVLEMGVCGPGEIVAGIVVFQNQLHGYDYEAANIPF